MKKITIWLSLSFLLAFCQTSIAQFSCDSPIMITDGYTADGITTPGTAGIEDWNDPNPDSCTSNAFYWDDDVYLFGYTAGANDEEISMTIFTRNGWNGIGIFSDCNGTALEGCLASASSTTGNVSQTVLANVGAGETVYIAIGQWGSPNDLDFDVTAFNAVELVDPPSCSTFTTPVDDSIDVLEDTAINWTQATGGATGYRISIGTSTGGVDIVNDLDLGNVLTYTPSTPLAYSTEYFVNVTPYNSNGDAQGCAELSFTTREEPPAGTVCGNPIEITTPLPYVTTDDTSNYGDDYTGGPGANCGSTSGYLGGDDVVYSYTPTVDTSIDIALSGVGTYTGIFVYTDCANIGSQCETGAVNGFAGGDMLIDNYTVTSGTTYYIVISTWPSPQSTPYTLTITENTCVDAEAIFSTVSDCANGDQFLLEVDLTSLGSAGTITISDDQGSTPQTVDAVGVYTFGPYAHGTPVIMTAANDDDSNCTLVSASLTENYCLDNIVDCAVGPVNTTFCYFNNIDDDPSVATFSYTSTDGSQLNLTINAGQMEGCCDELVVIDSDGTILYNQNTPNPAGLTFQSSGDTISWYINSDGSVSCENNGYTPFDVTVACATCINPQATYQVVDDCDNGDQFLIDVNVTSLGDANSLTISNNIDATTVSVPSEGIYQIGPFPFLVDVVVTVSSDDDVNCVINSSPIQLLACPPENDNPCNAIVATVNEDNSCDLVTAGTIIEATPSGVPDGECGGDPDDDVWFQFTALNEVQLISITNITGGTTNLDHGLYEGTCDGLTELYCSADTASVTPELVVGNTYYIRVFSGGSEGETSTFDLCIKDAPTNIICENAENFCQEGGALVTSNIIGIPDPNDIACLGSAPNPTWNIIQIGDPGLIEIEISQVDDNGNGIDVDFVLWGPFESVADSCTEIAFEDCPSCPNNTSNPDFYPFGNIVDCSYSFVSVENLTIDNAQTGEIYILLVTNFSDDPGTISISQTNGGDDGDGNVTAEIEVDLGPDQSFCGFPSYDLVADSPFADRYEWYCDGFIIEGEESSVLTVTESCTYTVIAYDDQCDAQAQDQVTVIFGLEPVANPVDDIVTCDDASGDEIEDFDLEMQTAGILGAQDPSLFNVTYHLTLTDAQTDTGALTSPYTNISNPQTIYVRVEDANPDASFCFATTSFDLIISGPTPTATSIDIEACDDNSGDGIEDFDLAAYDADILNGQDPTEFTVTYYETEADAEAGQNAIDTSSLYTSDSQTIYVRVESNSAFDCYSTTSVNLIVLPIPVATFNTTDVDYEVCPNATVPIEIALIPQGYSESDVTVEWYQDGGLISGETGLTLPVLTQGLYTAIITYNDSSCTYEVSETVIELESCIIPEGISPGVSPGQNDTFDLSSYGVTRLEIFNRNGVLVYSKDNYTNEWYGQSNSGDELPVGTYFYTMIYENGAKKRSAWVYINK